MAAVKAELDGFYLGDSLLAFRVITGVMFNNSPFHASYSKILGRGITVVALNLVLQRERLYSAGQRWEQLCATDLSGRSIREERPEYAGKS